MKLADQQLCSTNIEKVSASPYFILGFCLGGLSKIRSTINDNADMDSPRWIDGILHEVLDIEQTIKNFMGHIYLGKK